MAGKAAKKLFAQVDTADVDYKGAGTVNKAERRMMDELEKEENPPPPKDEKQAKRKSAYQRLVYA